MSERIFIQFVVKCKIKH